MAIDPTVLNELGSLANRVLNETSIGGNTAERVGTALVDAHTCLVGANDMSDDIEALQSSVSSLESRYTSLYSTLQSLQSSVSSLSNSITELRSTCSELEGRISTLESDVRDLTNDDFQVLAFDSIEEGNITIQTASYAGSGFTVGWSTVNNCFCCIVPNPSGSSFRPSYYSDWGNTSYYKDGLRYIHALAEGVANHDVWFYHTAEGRYYYWDGTTLALLVAPVE